MIKVKKQIVKHKVLIRSQFNFITIHFHFVTPTKQKKQKKKNQTCFAMCKTIPFRKSHISKSKSKFNLWSRAATSIKPMTGQRAWQDATKKDVGGGTGGLVTIRVKYLDAAVGFSVHC